MKKCVKIFAWISWWLQFYFGHCLSYNLNAIITKILLLIHRAKITNVHCCFNKCAQWFLFLWWCCLAAISDSVCRLPCCRTEIRKKAKYCLDKGRIFFCFTPSLDLGTLYNVYLFFLCNLCQLAFKNGYFSILCRKLLRRFDHIYWLVIYRTKSFAE